MALSGAEVTRLGISGYSQILYGDFSGKVASTAPSLVSATIATDGDSISLVFSEAVTIGAGGNAGVAITASGGASTATYSSGDGTNTLVYTLSRTIEYDETVTITYTQPGNGIEADDDGEDVASFSDETVVNTSGIGRPSGSNDFSRGISSGISSGISRSI